MEEQWKQIEGTYYEVSNTGKVRHAVNKTELSGRMVEIEHEPRRRETVARLVWAYFIGELPESRPVLKINTHLPPSVDNLRIADKKPRQRKRESHTQEILKLKSEGELTNSEIASSLGITPGAVTKCLKRYQNKKTPD